MRNGEMAQDRWGMWRFPLDVITGWYRPSIARHFHWTHCPFCNELLPNVSSVILEENTPPPAADATGDGEGQE